MSFERRKLSVEVYVNGNRGTATEIISIDGYRMVAHVITNGGMDTGQAQVQVFGLPLSLINQLTALPSTSTLSNIGRNLVAIYAAEGANAPEIVFEGNLLMAWGAFESAPDTSFMMHVASGHPYTVIPHPVTSVKGSVDAGSVLSQLAKGVGFGFQNHGVSAQLHDPYCVGSAVRQMRHIQKAARCNLDIDRGTVHIWPRNGCRSGAPTIIGPGNKLVGYPRAGGQYLNLRAEFLPEARLGMRIQVEGSQLAVANGTWAVQSATHALSAEMPGGPWFTDMNVQQINLPS